MKMTFIDWTSLQRASFYRNFSAILLSVFIVSCAPSQSETVVIRGSNTVGEELTPALIAEYQKEHPGVTFDTEFKGTTYGIGALMVDRCNIAAASREMTMNEHGLAHDRGVEFNDYIIGSYSVAVIVHSANTATNLSQDKMRDIFTGKIRNWKEVGGLDALIHLYIRDPISGTYLGFQELVMDKQPYGPNLKTFTNYAHIAQAVAKDPNGIGYVSMELANKPGITAVSIGGVPPTTAFVNKGQYPYARLLRFYTTKSKETTAAKDFIQFVQSASGQKIISDMGFVPRP